MKTLSRSLLILTPKKPFVNWVNSLPFHEDQPCALSDLSGDPFTFLIPECKSKLEVNQYLKQHASDVFEKAVDEWVLSSSEWPPVRNYDALCEFFRVDFSSFVYDTVETEDELVRK